MSVAPLPQPLAGKTILVTRAAGQSSQFTQLLEQAGASVVEMPALEIRPPSSWEALDRAIAQLKEIHWLILTSANGVTYFFQRLFDLGHSLADVHHLKIAAVGKKTAASLKELNIVPDFIPPDYVADSLVEHFPDAPQLHCLTLLFPRVEEGGREVLVNELTAKGATVLEVPAYQSGCPAAIAPPALDALQQKNIDVVTFASSKTVRHFCYLIEQAAQVNLIDKRDVLTTQVQIASIGPQTSQTCRELLGRVDIEAEIYTLEGLTSALENWALGIN
ncbi:MAG: uroporphyrinogen-III synthase [Leptolyngbyaceae bacterium]|nr:uroporphyrinogen-III synthase [Leptolyngbyaceae bacterium]